MDMRIQTAGACAVTMLGCAAHAQPLIGAEFRAPDFAGNAQIFDVSTTTGAATNGRATGADVISGLAWDGSTLFGVTDAFGIVNGDAAPGGLFTIDPVSGATTLVGNVGEPGGFLAAEGEIDFNPLTGTLVGSTSNNGQTAIFDIDPTTGTASNVRSVSGVSDLSAFAFDASGTLWGLDPSFTFGPDRPAAQLLTIDPATGDVLTSQSTDQVLGVVAGMDFNPITGELFVADGDTQGTNNLYTLDTSSASFSLVGATDLPDPFGLSGLSAVQFIPAPGASAVLAIAGIGAARRRR